MMENPDFSPWSGIITYAGAYYDGKTGQGILYLLFFWTDIPCIISLIEFIAFAVTNEETLQEKYSSANPNGIAVVLKAAR